MTPCPHEITGLGALSRRQALAAALTWPLMGPAQAAQALSAVAGMALPVTRRAQGLRAPSAWQDARQLGAEDFQGRWVYLDFWASWCTPCRQSFPWMNSLHARFEPRGLHVVAVGLDKTAERMEAFLKVTTPRFWVLWDAPSAWAQRLQIQSMPTSVLIRPDGQMTGWHRGYSQDIARQVEMQIQQLLPERS